MPGTQVDFECDDPDLKDFFANDWEPHEETLIAVTYGLFFDGVCVAKFALANDRVDAQEMGATKAERAEALADIPDEKRGYRHYPAVKIARLAVATSWRGKGIGAFILSTVKTFFVVWNKTGCRYMTVDSYLDAESFYREKGQFIPFPNRPAGKNTAMYFDLLITKQALEAQPKLKAEYAARIKTFAPNGYSMVLYKSPWWRDLWGRIKRRSRPAP